MKPNTHKLSVGDWVEILTKEEILETLDGNGQLDGMPFMPEMFEFCGKRFQVYKRAHKTCDPDFRSRRIDRAVHLETRCDGHAHGGCQAGCLIFWKEAWLKPVSRNKPYGADPHTRPRSSNTSATSGMGCTEADVLRCIQLSDRNEGEATYVCQTTEVTHAGKAITWWDIRQYLEDYSSGNESLTQLFSGFVYSMYYNLSNAGIGVGRAMRWFYDIAHPLWRGTKWPRKRGTIPEGQPTPTVTLDLQPGELVRVKSHDEILQTLNTGSKNRGLWWDAELVPYCGRTFRVLKRVTKVIDEKTGKMLIMKSPSIILDSAICRARYSDCRMFCPRSTYAYWREIWLERVDPHMSCNGTASSLTAIQTPISNDEPQCQPRG
jgi:hypothetical protein